MLFKPSETEKLYYSISEVAEMLNVNASLIRFWEKEFDIIRPHKTRKGNRLFTREDLDKLQLVYHLVKEKGFTLQGARDALKQNSNELQAKQRLHKTLLEMRQLVSSLRDSLPAPENQ